MNIYERVIEYYGNEAQFKKTFEELDELKIEIRKYLDGKDNIDELTSEIADAYNMLYQVLLMSKIPLAMVEAEMARKMKRTLERIVMEVTECTNMKLE